MGCCESSAAGPLPFFGESHNNMSSCFVLSVSPCRGPGMAREVVTVLALRFQIGSLERGVQIMLILQACLKQTERGGGVRTIMIMLFLLSPCLKEQVNMRKLDPLLA